MSFQWNYGNNNTDNISPGSTNNFNNTGETHNNINHFATEKLLQDFNNALIDHKKKQNNLIQNFLSSNAKFDEVTSYFMSQINPTIKSTSDKYKEENKLLHEEISRLKSEIQTYIKHIETEKKQREELALNIMHFCDTSIDPTEFEHFIGALFTCLGYKVEHVGKTHDGGIDLIIRHFKNGKGVVQVKQYRRNSKVTEPQIRDLFGAMSAKQEVEYGIMVVLSDCTKEAKTWPQRENVTNLKIWTNKELVSLLEEKGVNTLLEFIKTLKQKHENDIKNINFITPKNPYKNSKNNNNRFVYSQQSKKHLNTSLRQRSSKKNKQHSSSALSSAKKQKRQENMVKSWSNFKFSDVNNKKQIFKINKNEENICNNNNNNFHDEIKNNENKNINLNNDEISACSSNDSSLLIDESQSDHESEQHTHIQNMNGNNNDIDFNKINNIFNSNTNLSKSTEYINSCDGMNDLNIKLLWSLQNNNNNMNKPRRPRRKWSNNDDIILIKAIKQFSTNWNETDQNQWNTIHQNCSFTHQFSVKDIKKHYSQVLKPKLLSNNNSETHLNQ